MSGPLSIHLHKRIVNVYYHYNISKQKGHDVSIRHYLLVSRTAVLEYVRMWKRTGSKHDTLDLITLKSIIKKHPELYWMR